jgi:hypothetical protein
MGDRSCKYHENCAQHALATIHDWRESGALEHLVIMTLYLSNILMGVAGSRINDMSLAHINMNVRTGVDLNVNYHGIGHKRSSVPIVTHLPSFIDQKQQFSRGK